MIDGQNWMSNAFQLIEGYTIIKGKKWLLPCQLQAD